MIWAKSAQLFYYARVWQFKLIAIFELNHRMIQPTLVGDFIAIPARCSEGYDRRLFGLGPQAVLALPLRPFDPTMAGQRKARV